ncbi:MAG TPA: HAMP domain-containing histidine kinase [Candidatus Butyricicoccus avistercoris]|uniref:histidine kinase n=1 Tax=Candidatus Butyricicoccus avistercoris TaxID=2838518 RepID=A0A9D1TGX4_9FIRM|nr:HAMP domain-containing histidine kinase [Candidatus Butyricicoccus avistercoris]
MKIHNVRFRDKIQIIIVLMLTISISICGTWLIGKSFTSAKTQRIDAAQNAQRMAMYTLISTTSDNQWDNNKLSGTLRLLERQVGQRFKLTDEDGNVIYQKQYNDQSFKDGMIEKVSDNKMAWRIQINSLGNHEIQTASAINNGEKLYYLESIYPIENVYKSRDYMISSFMGITLVIIAMGIFIARKVSYWITGSLTRLAETARAIASGDLSERVNIKSDDEIGQLADDFNRMADQVSENINKLENAMQRQEEFMASFAHEMRTPMTSIIGYADLMRSQELPPDMRRQAANYIFTEGKRLESLSNKLLDIIVLQKTTINKQECKMSSLIEQVYGLLEKRMKESNIEIDINCDDSTWLVEPDLFKTLISNLLDNARKAMPDGGNITIIANKKADIWQIEVKDTGYGIPKEEMPKLTDAFYRVDKARARASGGAGLGLKLCSQIVKLHNGIMSFSSEQGKGTTVTVTLRKDGL